MSQGASEYIRLPETALGTYLCIRSVTMRRDRCLTMCTRVNEVKCKSERMSESVYGGTSNNNSHIVLLKRVLSSKRLLGNESGNIILYFLLHSGNVQLCIL